MNDAKKDVRLMELVSSSVTANIPVCGGQEGSPVMDKALYLPVNLGSYLHP